MNLVTNASADQRSEDAARRTDEARDKTVAVDMVSTLYAPAIPLEETMESFWDVGEGFDAITIDLESAVHHHGVILKELGPSPFERGGFPLIGFLATTYDKASRHALNRGREEPLAD